LEQKILSACNISNMGKCYNAMFIKLSSCTSAADAEVSALQADSSRLTETVQQFIAEAFLQDQGQGHKVAAHLSQCWSQCQPAANCVTSPHRRHDNRSHLQYSQQLFQHHQQH
jgi:hypothetical protein